MTAPVAILAARRTPVGRFGKGLSRLSATALGTAAAAAALEDAGAAAAASLSVFGQVLQAGCGQNPARQVALGAGLAPTASAYTVNMVCGSGLKAVHLAAQAIREGAHDLALAGGMESMSNAPYLSPKSRWGATYGDIPLVDSMLRDGLTDAGSGEHMGLAAERVAAAHSVSRAEMDAYAEESHRRALAAREGFAAEIAPVAVGKEVVAADENPRATTAGALAALRPVFAQEGTVTAGNSSALNDGAAAVVLASGAWVEERGATPLAWLGEGADGGVAPEDVLMSPVEVFATLTRRHGKGPGDYDILEINEAFAVQMVALTKALSLDPAKLNPRGGAVALGHPIGCSGARLVVTLAHQLAAGGGGEGFAALCLGGGNGTGLAVRTHP